VTGIEVSVSDDTFYALSVLEHRIYMVERYINIVSWLAAWLELTGEPFRAVES
jgi:hypothetical protein